MFSDFFFKLVSSRSPWDHPHALGIRRCGCQCICQLDAGQLMVWVVGAVVDVGSKSKLHAQIVRQRSIQADGMIMRARFYPRA